MSRSKAGEYAARLDETIVLHPQSDASEHAVLEHVPTARYFRIGVKEERFLRCLLANASFPEAMEQSGLEEGHIQELAGWLNSIGLLPELDTPPPGESSDASGVNGGAEGSLLDQASVSSVPARSTPEAAHNLSSAACNSQDPPATKTDEQVGANAANSGGLSKLSANLFFAKIPLFNPDSFLTWIVGKVGWLFSWQSAIFVLVFAGFGGLALLGSWHEFMHNYQDLFAPGRWLTLGLGWFVLKLVHEIGHGATCKRYGGSVPKAGVALILFMPIAFVDVTSCWRFNSKWKRIHVALGGVLAECYIAGIALWCWHYTDSVFLKQVCADLVLLATVTSAIFNLNPLMKFDGYFVLADFTNRQNLYQTGQRYSRYFGARYLLGLANTSKFEVNSLASWVKLYALSASTWRTLTMLGLVTAASIMFEGAGVLLAFLGFGLFIGKPLVSLARFLNNQFAEGNLALGAMLTRVSLLSVVMIGALFVIPAELQQATPGIVEYDPPSVIRAPADGFIEAVYADNGELVKAGQAIFRMRNDKLQVELTRLEKECQLFKQAVRSARWQNDTAKLNEALADLEGVTSRLQELRRSVEDLIVLAPVDGRLVSRGLQNSAGRFIERGEELGAVGSEAKKRLHLSMSQWEASKAKELIDEQVVVTILGEWSWRERIGSIESHASEVPADRSLTVPSGGTLAVLAADDGEPRLCSPRVNAYISLNSERSQQLRCGQRCWVSLPIWKKSLGQAALDSIQQKIPNGISLGMSY